MTWLQTRLRLIEWERVMTTGTPNRRWWYLTGQAGVIRIYEHVRLVWIEWQMRPISSRNVGGLQAKTFILFWLADGHSQKTMGRSLSIAGVMITDTAFVVFVKVNGWRMNTVHPRTRSVSIRNHNSIGCIESIPVRYIDSVVDCIVSTARLRYALKVNISAHGRVLYWDTAVMFCHCKFNPWIMTNI